MLQNILFNLGLTEKEAELYLACLKLGSAKVSELAELANINRVTAYTVLEKLLEKGFVSQVTKGNSQAFLAVDPEMISDAYQEKLKQFNNHIVDFQSLSTLKSPLKINYYEGVDELKKIYLDTLNSKTEILNIINEDAIVKMWPSYEEDYVQKRSKKKIFLRGLALDTKSGKRLQQKEYEFYRRIKLVSKSAFEFSNDIMIYDDKLAIFSWLSLGGVVMDNAEIAKTHKALFEMAWNLAK